MNHRPLIAMAEFPLVVFDPPSLRTIADYDRFEQEWRSLVLGNAPFVLIANGTHPDDEPPEVARRRAAFFKEQRPAMEKLCLASCVVVDDPEKRAALDRKAEPLRRNFGARIDYVASAQEARDRAKTYLLTLP